MTNKKETLREICDAIIPEMEKLYKEHGVSIGVAIIAVEKDGYAVREEDFGAGEYKTKLAIEAAGEFSTSICDLFKRLEENNDQ